MSYSDNNEVAIAGVEEVLRKLDQMLTMHSILRDRYAWRAGALSVGLILGSVLLCGFTFSEDRTFITIGIDAVWARFSMGAISLVLLALSVCEMKVDWKGVSDKHGEAVAILAKLKPKLRELKRADSEDVNTLVARVGREFAKACDSLVPIPEKDFVRLKSRHLQKIEISRLVSAYPKCPLFVLRFRLWWDGIRSLGRSDDDKSDDGSARKSAVPHPTKEPSSTGSGPSLPGHKDNADQPGVRPGT